MRIDGVEVPWNSIGQLVAARANELGDKFALEVVGTRFTYRELHELSEHLAGNLAALGIEKGDVVCFFTYNCSEMVLTYIALSKLSAVWAPINVGLAGTDLKYTLNDLEPKLLVVDAETREMVEASGHSLSGLARSFIVGANDVDGYAAFDPLLLPGRSSPDVTIEPGDPSIILYTGGTTGLPKGVVIPQFYFICACLRYLEAWDPRPDDVHYSTLPLYHIGSHHCALVPMLINGTPAVIDRWFSVRRYWPRVRETDATTIDPMSTMVTLLVQQPASDEDRNHRVRLTWNSCTTVPTQIVEEFIDRFGIPMFGTYGGSEAGGGYVAACPLGERYRLHANAKDWRWCEIRIADENDEEVATDEIGEILMRPVIPFSFALGYWKNEAKTVEVMRNYWYHTGDLGRIDEDGYLYFIGRQAHWLRRRGENISAYEVEALLSNYPGVAEVCVVGVPSELGEEEVKAFLVSSEGNGLDPERIVRWCEGQIASFKIPRFIEFVDDFPRSASKHEIERSKLKARANDRAWDRERP